MLFLYSAMFDGEPAYFRNYLLRTFFGTILLYIIINAVYSNVQLLVFFIILLSPSVFFLSARRATYAYFQPAISTIDIRDYENPHWNVTWITLSDARQNCRLSISSGATDVYSAAKIEFPETNVLEQSWWQRPLRSVPRRSIELQVTMNYQRTRDYLTLLTAGLFSIQSVNNGLLFTAPRLDHDVKADFVNLNTIPDQFTQPWNITLQDNYISVYLNNRPVWKSDVDITLRDLVLGDLQNTPDHGGILVIEKAVFHARILYM